MKNITRRSLALFMAIVMCLSLLNLSVFADDDSNVVDITYICKFEDHVHTDDCYEISGDPICDFAADTDDAEAPDEGTEVSDGTSDANNAEPGDDAEDETGDENDGADEDEDGDETNDADKSETGDENDDADKSETGDENDGADEANEIENTEGNETAVESVTTDETDATEASDGGVVPVDGGNTSYRPAHRAIRAFNKANSGVEDVEDAEDAEDAGEHVHTADCYERTLICEKHTHDLTCWARYDELTDAVQSMSDSFSAFMEEFFEALTGEEEDPMADFAAAAAEQFGEEFNALLELYKSIPEEVANGELYDDLTGGLEMLASAMGGDLNDGITLLAAGVIYCDTTDISNETHFARSDGDHLITVNGTWNGTLEFGAGDITIKGNGTIDATGKNRSAIVVKGTAKVTLEGNVTVTGGTGTKVKWAEIVERDTTNGESAGGAVLVESGATFTMKSGTITENSAIWGGGISVARGGKLNIYGGTITKNTATGTAGGKKIGGGGGIFCAGTGVIDPTQGSSISITENTCDTANDLGGGGIFLESKGTMQIINAIVTGNTADGLGGGVAGCLHGMISNLSPETAEIHDNTANRENSLANTNKAVDHDSPYLDWNEDLKNAATDYFCAGYSVIATRALAGTAVWNGQAVYRAGNGHTKNERAVVSTNSTDPIVVQGLCGLTATYTNTGARPSNTVTITDNTSTMHGGGIGANGVLTFGEYTTNFSYSDSKLSLVATKAVKDALNSNASKAGYTFVLSKNADGSDPIASVTTGADGKISFSNIMTSTLFGDNTEDGTFSTTLYIVERSGTTLGMKYDTDARKIELTVKRSSDSTTVKTNGGKNQVTRVVYTDTIESAKVNGVPVTPSNNTVTLPNKSGENATFVNEMEYGKVSVTKVVEETHNSGKKFSFTVEIGNAKFYPELGKDETWTSDDYPVGTKYSVTETGNANGYTATGEVSNGTIAEGTNAVTVTNTRDEKSLTVTKKVDWNAASVAPSQDDVFEISVTLGDGGDKTPHGNATVYAGAGVYTFKLKNGEEATITGIPTNTQYLVSEGAMPAFEYRNTNKIELDNRASLTDDTTVEVKNHYYKAKTTDISVTKNWVGGEDYRPTSVWVQLMRDGEPDGEQVRLCATNNWTKKWEDLPAYAGDGKAEHNYTVKEVSVDYPGNGNQYKADDRDGNIIRVRSSVAANDGSGNEIVGGWVVTESGMDLTNTWIPADELGTASFEITKVDSESNKPIKGATFELSREGYETRTVASDANGKLSFDGLKNGSYTLKEIEPAEGYLANNTEWKITIDKDKLQTVTEDDGKYAGHNAWSWTASVGNSVGGMTISNDIVMGKISIAKVLDLDNVTEGTAAAAGDKEFTFQVIAVVVPYSNLEEGNVVTTLKVEAGKTDTTDDLRYGTYIVKELVDDVALTDYKWTEVSFADVDDAYLVKDDDGNVIGFQVKIEEQKTDAYSFTAINHYERNTGDLSVTKTVTGGRGDRTKAWNFELTLKAPAGYVNLDKEFAYTISGGETEDSGVKTPVTPYELALQKAKAAWDAEQDNLTDEQVATPFDEEAWMAENPVGNYDSDARVITFQLKHGESIKIKGLPVGTTYKVTEAEANTDGYRTTANGAEGTIVAETVADAQFINNNPNPGNPPDEPPEEPEIPDPEVPLDPFDPEEPDPNEDVELPEPDVPLAEFEIPDEDVPLSDVPTTGDNSGIWTILAIISGIGLVWLALEDRKRKNNAK